MGPYIYAGVDYNLTLCPHSRVDSNAFTIDNPMQSRPWPYASVDFFIPKSWTLDLAKSGSGDAAAFSNSWGSLYLSWDRQMRPIADLYACWPNCVSRFPLKFVLKCEFKRRHLSAPPTYVGEHVSTHFSDHILHIFYSSLSFFILVGIFHGYPDFMSILHEHEKDSLTRWKIYLGAADKLRTFYVLIVS